MSTKRGRGPTQQTVQLLCARAAGRCEFEGCGITLYEEILTRKSIRNSVVAHIVAASPDGPRGDSQRSYELSQSIDNLMLLCPTHHTLIDTQEKDYPEARLLSMKKTHEDCVERLCTHLQSKPSEMLSLASPIKGQSKVTLDQRKQSQALLPEHYATSLTGPIFDPESNKEYHSKEYWRDVDQQLEATYRNFVDSSLKWNPTQHFSIFPLAPIPLVVKLGYLLGDKSTWNIYQFHREFNSWCWQNVEQTNQFTIHQQTFRSGGSVALILSLTADISLERIKRVSDVDSVITIRAKRFGVDCIRSTKDLTAFWHCYQKACDQIKKTFPDVEEILVFPAIPTSAAFEVGRRYMSGVYPRLKLYDDDNGFFETLTIGGES